MSKVMATSGNHAPVIKGSAGGSGATGDAAAGLFSAVFGGMQKAETDSDADAAHTQTDASGSEQIIEQNLAALPVGMRRSVSELGKTDSQTSDDLHTEGSSLDTDKLAEAGLLAAHSQLSDIGKRQSGQPLQQVPSSLTALAEDLKQPQTKTPAAQIAQEKLQSVLDEDFIGPPLPRDMKKSEIALLHQSENNVKEVMTVARQTARSHDKMLQRPELITKALGVNQSANLTEELADTNILDASSLKADRLSELTTRLGDKSVHVATPSVQLTASAASDAQTGVVAGQQANAAQTGGQQSGAGSTFTGTAPTDLAEQWLDVLDMQDEKWTDQLVRRIDREFRTGGRGLELEMNPRNLGRLKVSLSVVQDQTNVVLRTETGAAAQMLIEAEGRLAQMLGGAGLKLGQFDAFTGGQNRDFGQHDGQHEQNGTMTEAQNESQTGDTDMSDGLVNLRA